MQPFDGRRSGSRRFTRVNLNVWLIILVALAWGIIRYRQGAFALSWEGFLTLCGLALVSAIARTWVGLRDPKVMFQFTLPLAIFDILLIAVAVYFTGGYVSEAWILYFALLGSEAAVMSTPALFTMLGLSTVTYGIATLPWSTEIAPGFFFRMATVGLTAWLMHQLLRSHVEYRLELERLREQIQLARERERIAQEFHDGIGHTLVSVILGLQAFCQEARKQGILSESHHACLQEQVAVLRNALDETRQIIRQLEPLPIVDLCQEVRQMAERTAQRLGAQLHLTCPPTLPALNPLQSLMLTRVLREAFTNILKHAPNTRTIALECKVSEGLLTIILSDDGEGFDPKQVIPGFGLRHMQERIESLGGHWDLESAPQRGTRIAFSIPLGGES